ncbi:transposase [Sinorhizobium meliloti]|nr:transposase [Sinorhizobium meliloti]
MRLAFRHVANHEDNDVSIRDLEILAGSVRRRKFTRVDKEAIVSETLNGDTSVADVARRHEGGGNGAWFDHAEQCLFDRVIDPQATESNAAWLAIVEQTTPAGIARNVMIASGVPDCQLPTAPLTTEKAGKRSVAMLRRSVMTAGRHIVADHLADLLRPFPTDVTFVCIRDQRQPFIRALRRIPDRPSYPGTERLLP